MQSVNFEVAVKRRLITIGALLWALGAPANAGGESTAPPLAIEGDHAILATIVSNAVSEMQLCALALQKSQNAELRAFCRNVSSEDERTALAGVQLAARLGAGNVTLTPPQRTTELIAQLDRYANREFDRYFLLLAIGRLGNEEVALKYALDVTTDRSLRRFESAVLPIVARHLDTSENVLRRVSELPP